jgi:flagellar hook protein FlgE
MSGNFVNAVVMGMNAQTSCLATISQNIANSNTTEYKDVEMEFPSIANQSGAINYSTVTDLPVQGAGFFAVTDVGGDTFLTRNSSFVADASRNPFNSARYSVMGADVQSNTTPVANSNVFQTCDNLLYILNKIQS